MKKECKICRYDEDCLVSFPGDLAHFFVGMEIKKFKEDEFCPFIEVVGI